mmetsp:Transcript_12749/g.34269  ORF Transcript_12749/g.34269 Transcript_12749/m.34269 type:complete len:91 (+) Transcript_12749:1472-1744(+)
MFLLQAASWDIISVPRTSRVWLQRTRQRRSWRLNSPVKLTAGAKNLSSERDPYLLQHPARMVCREATERNSARPEKKNFFYMYLEVYDEV